MNVYAFKPASVAKVLEHHPSVRCIAGHSIGGLWAVEFARDLHDAGAWPKSGLSFCYLGVHGKGVSIAPFRELPWTRVGWTFASEDVTLRRAAEGDVPGYVERVRTEELPRGATSTIYAIDGGNHENYGSYGSPGAAQGLAYKDLPATVSGEEQRAIVARAIAETAALGPAGAST